MDMNIRLRGMEDPVRSLRLKRETRRLAIVAFSMVMMSVLLVAPTEASQLRELSAKQKTTLEENFRVALQKRKGPFGKKGVRLQRWQS